MRKIAAHYIFPITAEPIKYGVLTLDDDGTVLNLSQSRNSLPETPSVEFYNGIIVPGFVNAHCHLELSHMLGALPQGGGMGAFCEGIMGNRNVHTAEQQQQAMFLADKQMFNEGVVAVGDISNGNSSFAVKQQSPVYYHTFVECLGFGNNRVEAIIQHALMVQKMARDMGLSASITPHAPYSMSEKLFAESVRLAQTDGVLSIHNQESYDEMELFATGTSKLRAVFEQQGFEFDEAINTYHNPIDRILAYINTITRLLLVHNVHTTTADVNRVAALNNHATWVLCPNSNLYIDKALPPAAMLHRKKVNVAIGTDSLSSNTNLSILDELKTLNSKFPQIPLTNLLQWATLGGAKALAKDDVFGSFDVGKRPGVTLIDGIDFDSMQLTPLSKSSNLLL